MLRALRRMGGESVCVGEAEGSQGLVLLLVVRWGRTCGLKVFQINMSHHSPKGTGYLPGSAFSLTGAASQPASASLAIMATATTNGY